MNIFELNIFLLFIYTLIFLKIFKTSLTKEIFLWLITTQLILINGLRHISVGIDTFRYEKHFYDINSLSSMSEFMNYDMEIGYKILQKVMGLFTSNFQICLMIMAFIMYYSFAIFVRKHSSNFFVSYFLFVTLGFFDFSLSGIRQSLAMLLGIHLYTYALNRQKKHFIIMLIISLSFHYSAIILVPIYILVNKKPKSKDALVLTVFYLALYFNRNNLGRIFTRFYYEGDSLMLSRYESSGSLGTMSIFILITVIFGLLLHNPFDQRTSKNHVGLWSIALISFFLQTLSSFSYLFTRLNFYFLIFMTIYYPKLFEVTKGLQLRDTKNLYGLIKIVLKIALVFILVFYYLTLIANNANSLLPYNFFWEL